MVRLIGGLKRWESTRMWICKLDWMNIFDLRTYHDLVQLNMITTSSQPWSIAIQLNNEFSRNTRRAEDGSFRSTQDTAPTDTLRSKFFISRACKEHGAIKAYTIPTTEGPKVWKAELRQRLRWRTWMIPQTLANTRINYVNN